MAVVYHSVNGMELDAFIAHMSELRKPIQKHTLAVARRAWVEKNKWRDLGHSYIDWSYDGIDGWIILNDTRGEQAAMSMEYGSAPHRGFPEGTPAQSILHNAARIPMKATWPRSKRFKQYRVRDRSRKRRRR